MKIIKEIEIKKLYSLLFDEKKYGEMGPFYKSASIVEIYDSHTKTTHFSQWFGVTNTLDLLPGGRMYLADDFDGAIKELEERYQSC